MGLLRIEQILESHAILLKRPNHPFPWEKGKRILMLPVVWLSKEASTIDLCQGAACAYNRRTTLLRQLHIRNLKSKPYLWHEDTARRCHSLKLGTWSTDLLVYPSWHLSDARRALSRQVGLLPDLNSHCDNSSLATRFACRIAIDFVKRKRLSHPFTILKNKKQEK